jgi:hypothetical protein
MRIRFVPQFVARLPGGLVGAMTHGDPLAEKRLRPIRF